MSLLRRPFRVVPANVCADFFRRNLLLWGLLCAAATYPCAAQTLADLNVSLHGYATQSFLYSDHNSWNTTDSEDGSASWTETVLNVSAQPQSKLRIGVQARFFLLGDFGNKITLDWAQADYKVNERFGFRVGKVKTPVGLYNESQDIDPAHVWSLLPQSVYPIASRNSQLAHFGGVGYGTMRPGESFGKIEYRVFGGQRIVASDDGYFQSLRDFGISVPNGTSGHTFGGSLHWVAPVRGLMFGASEMLSAASGKLTTGPYTGSVTIPRNQQLDYFGRYERNRLMLAGEYNRTTLHPSVVIPGLSIPDRPLDSRAWYAMGTYRISGKLTVGAYYSNLVNRGLPYTSDNYEKDIVVSGRYDFSPYLYVKLEQHFMNGTAVGFSAGDNPTLQPKTDLTVVKLGVSF